MIKFFRKIRQKLLSNNKFSQYLVYAVGEIILVVLGILIALQINNWNSENKESQLEVKMLKEIKIALQSDLKDIEFNLKEHHEIFQSQQLVIDWLKTDAPYTDSLSFHFANAVNGTNFLSNKGSYETIKGIGIQLIKNDNLRKQILNLYELQYKDYDSILHEINEYRFDLMRRENVKYFQATSPYFKMKPLDVEMIKSENGYTYHLMTIISLNRYFIEQKITPTKVAIEKAIKNIENELSNE